MTPSQLAFPYLVNWGYPERFHQEARPRCHDQGDRRLAGVIEGIARVVLTVDEFDDVRDGDILVCQMTNPAWVVLFTKIAGLVTDTGGMTSHPAVLSREFGIPAVIGTSTRPSGSRPAIGSGSMAAQGVVEILGRDRAEALEPSAIPPPVVKPAMAVARALSRSVLADQVKERILEDILNGNHPPDSRIIETKIARELGTSQAPVREALRGLEALGVVEITPFRGARVRRPSKREIIEAYAVRSSLESLAARLAVPRMTDADLAGLSGISTRCARPAQG